MKHDHRGLSSVGEERLMFREGRRRKGERWMGEMGLISRGYDSMKLG